MGAAAIVILRRERDVIEHFRAAGAVTPDSAQSISALRIQHDALPLRRLQTRAVIRSASSGTVYLDEPSWAALRRARQRVTAVALIIGLALGLGVMLAARA